MTNALGVAFMLLTTNQQPETFQLEMCPSCGRGHYRVIQNFTLVKSNVVPALVSGRFIHLPVESLTNLISIPTTQFVEHAAMQKSRFSSPLPFPALPPDPRMLYMQHRSRMTPTVVPPISNSSSTNVPPIP